MAVVGGDGFKAVGGSGAITLNDGLNGITQLTLETVGSFAVTGDNALKVNVGETVRFYYGQANDESWIHIIGGHFDKVYVTGSFHPDGLREYGVETTAVPAGSVTVVEYTFKVPGLYLLVNHKLIRATEKGQAVHIVVEGEENPDIMTVIEPPTAIQ